MSQPFIDRPVWFQVVQNRNPTVAGLLLLPYLFGLVIVGIIYAFLLRLSGSILSTMHKDNRYKKRVILIMGAVLFLIGIVLISSLLDKLPVGALVVILLIFGAGSGLVLQTSFIEAQSAVSSDDVAMANSLAVVFEYFGGAVGLTISGTINRLTFTQKTSSIPSNLVNPYRANELPTEAAREAVRSIFQGSLLLTLRALVGFAAAVLVVSVLFVGTTGGVDSEEERRDGDEMRESGIAS
ncbi:MAG: hypothetical protein Q9166_006232 [cf. Caloplaca sp. 2 TL-2023]